MLQDHHIGFLVIAVLAVLIAAAFVRSRRRDRGKRDDRKAMLMDNAELLPVWVELLRKGHTVTTMPLRGNSMRPFLEDRRDKALLTQAKQVSVGDPVLAEIAPGHYVLHRIVAINGDRVTLRGDGNLGDEHCRQQDVKASVIGFYRKGHTKLDRTDGHKWRLYSWWWMRLYPVRRWLLAAYRRLWIPLFGPL